MAVYLSKLMIDTNGLDGRKMLADAYEAHRRIWSAFPDAGDGGPGRVMFRIEPCRVGDPVVVLVQSDAEPDWAPLLRRGIIADAISKEFRPNCKADQSFRFRLRANPTKKIADDKRPRADGSPRPARVGLFGEEMQMNWLRGKAEKGGFRLVECRIAATENSDSKKEGIDGKIRHLGVTFEGVLEVTDPDLFRHALESGIGSAKGFGFGLLSIAPVRR